MSYYAIHGCLLPGMIYTGIYATIFMSQIFEN